MKSADHPTLRAEPPQGEASRRDVSPQKDIAIIGMACLFPRAPDLQTYWQNIVSKVDAISDPPEEWLADLIYDPDSSENDRIYCKRGGWLGELARFDPIKYGVMPVAVEGSEPDQFLALRVTYEALADAGYLDRPFDRERVEVILGRGTYLNSGNATVLQHGLVVEQTLRILKQLHPEHTDEELQAIKQELKASLPPFNANTALGVIPNIMTGRIANRLDLMGPNFLVDAACASALIAVQLGMEDLLAGRCDMAIVGGVQAQTSLAMSLIFCQLNAMSRQGDIRPFDKEADGTVMGEGVGIIVLKRREDAERDGDRIYALVKGVGVASDGRGLGLSAPRLEGEVLALRRAYEMTGISPRSIEMIEAHGTGTPLGDPTEVRALHQVFGSRDGSSLPHCALGSVKSMIGHALPAAGIAGLIKAALALYHKVLPPTLKCDEPHPELELEKTPFYINTETRPWVHGTPDYPRRAGVNAFGFGGINAHAILEEYTADGESGVSLMQEWDSEVFILEGDSRASLIEQGRRWQRLLAGTPHVALKDLAYTLNTDLGGKAYRLAIVASSLEDLKIKLEHGLERLADPQRTQIKDRSGIYYSEQPLGKQGKLAFLFPGEGAQYVNMLHDLCLHFPEVRACFDEMDRVFAHHGRGYVPSRVIFPPPAFSEAERRAAERRLWQIDVAIEALLTANHALYTLLDHLGIRPDALLGHSTGEYSAMRAAGVLDEMGYGQRLLELNRLHEGFAAKGSVPEATLLAVGAGRDQVAAIAEDVGSDLYVAMDNCPHQTVLVGSGEAVDRALERIRGQGLIYEVLPFDRAYHTPLFAPYAEVLRDFLAGWVVAPPQVPLYSCTTTAPYPADTSTIRRIALEHWVQPVEFRQTIEAMYADGVRVFVEVGPRGNLTAFVDDILRARPHLAIALDVPSRSGITQLNHAVALLAAHGIPMRLDNLYHRRAPRRLSLEEAVDRAEMHEDMGTTMKLALGLPILRLRQGSPTMEQRSRGAEVLSGAKEQEQGSRGTEEQRSKGAGEQGSRGAREAEETSQAAVGWGDQPGTPAQAAQVVSAYLQTMEHFLEVQQEVMQAYLDRSKTCAEPGRSIQSSKSKVQTPNVQSPTSNLQPFDYAQGGPPTSNLQSPISNLQPPPDAAGIEQILLRLVSDRTGYPTEMLDLNLDLEADLGIDSIKRVEILGAFQQQTGVHLGEKMEQLAARKTLQGIIELLMGEQGARDEATRQRGNEATRQRGAEEVESPISNIQSLISDLPFVQKLLSLTPGQTLEAQCEISLDRYPFLRDHTLGRQVSLTDPELAGLPVMPLTMSMEMLAEAAYLLVPDKVLVGMRDVRAYRWVVLEEGSLTLKITAIRKSARADHDEVRVQVHEADAQTVPATPIIEGTVMFDETYPDPPTVPPFELRGERPSRWTPEQLYEEGMFHGPAFRGVVSMGRWGEDGAEAALEVLPLEGLFAPQADGRLLTDPVLLDQPGQVVALWMAEHLERGYVIFPFRVEALHLYGPPLPVQEKVKCQARIELVGEGQVRSDLDVVRGDGRVWARFEGWEDRRFDVPRSFFRQLLNPRDTMLSSSWSVPLAQLPQPRAFQCCRLDADEFPEGFFEAHGGIWRRVLVHLALSRQEREVWRKLNKPERRRTEWLLGRAVAKDAARLYLRDRYGMELCPADIEIVADERGQPRVQVHVLRPKSSVLGPTSDVGRVTWDGLMEKLEDGLVLSLTHSGGVVVALVGGADVSAGVGVDVEHVGRVNKDVERVAFTPEEQELLSSVRHASNDDWPLRFWCAKEAVAKALGQGMVAGPQGLVVKALDVGSGLVKVNLAGEMARRCPESSNTLTAYTVREDDLIVATAWCERWTGT